MTVSELREKIKLPDSYNPNLPEEERKAILKRALTRARQPLIEKRLLNLLSGREANDDGKPKQEKGRRSAGRGSYRQRVLRCISVYGDSTAKEIEFALGITSVQTQGAISNLVKDKFLSNVDVAEDINGIKLRVVGITALGVDFLARNENKPALEKANG